jgi:cysteine desulfurase
MRQHPVFLDFHSTTPVDRSVFEAMRPWFSEGFGNPHSADHAYGWRAEEAVEAARRDVARSIGAEPSEIIFTSGATESNNLALQGVAAMLPPGRRHIIVTATAHPCIAGVADRLEAMGHPVTRLYPARDGRHTPEALRAALRPDTGLVSIEAAQHEIGTVQPVDDFAVMLAPLGIAFHTDAAQALGRVSLDVRSGIDLMSLSAHKVYGPKGIGALYMRRRPGLELAPLFSGGGQQRGLRPGTIPTPLVVGFAEACRRALVDMTAESDRLAGLRNRLLAGLAAGIPGLAVNGTLDQRLAGNLNVRLPGIAAVDLLYDISDSLAISAGSACASARIEASPTLLAIGLNEAEALSSIRIGLGRPTTDADMDHAIATLVAAWLRLAGRERAEIA